MLPELGNTQFFLITDIEKISFVFYIVLVNYALLVYKTWTYFFQSLGLFFIFKYPYCTDVLCYILLADCLSQINIFIPTP